MIFGQIKMLITILLITGIAGAGMYVMKLRADNATLKANQIKLETAVAEQNKVLEQQEKDFKAIMESNKKLNVLINTFKKEVRNKKDLEETQGLIKKYKALEATFKRAEYFVNVSYDALAIFPDTEDKRILQNLTSFSLNRSF